MIRPKVTLKRDTYPLELFDQIYMLHDYDTRHYIKNEITLELEQEGITLKEGIEKIVKIIEKYYDVTWI